MAVNTESKYNFLIFSTSAKEQSQGKNKIIDQVFSSNTNAWHCFHLSQQK